MSMNGYLYCQGSRKYNGNKILLYIKFHYILIIWHEMYNDIGWYEKEPRWKKVWLSWPRDGTQTSQRRKGLDTSLRCGIRRPWLPYRYEYWEQRSVSQLRPFCHLTTCSGFITANLKSKICSILAFCANSVFVAPGQSKVIFIPVCLYSP